MDKVKMHKQSAQLEKEMCKKLLEISINERGDELVQSEDMKYSVSTVSSRKSQKCKSATSSYAKLSPWNNSYSYSSKNWKRCLVSNSLCKSKETTRNLTKCFLLNEYKAKLKNYNYIFRHFTDSRNYIRHYRKHHSSTSVIRSLSAITSSETGREKTLRNNRDTVRSTPLSKPEAPMYAADTVSCLLKENTDRAHNAKYHLNGQSTGLDPCLVYKYKLAPHYINKLLSQLPARNIQNRCILLDPSGSRHSNAVYGKSLPDVPTTTFSLTKRESGSDLAMNKCDEIVENSIAPQAAYTKVISTNHPLSVNGMQPHTDVNQTTTIFPRCNKSTGFLTAFDTKHTEKRLRSCTNEVNAFLKLSSESNTNCANDTDVRSFILNSKTLGETASVSPDPCYRNGDMFKPNTSCVHPTTESSPQLGQRDYDHLALSDFSHYVTENATFKKLTDFEDRINSYHVSSFNKMDSDESKLGILSRTNRLSVAEDCGKSPYHSESVQKNHTNDIVRKNIDFGDDLTINDLIEGHGDPRKRTCHPVQPHRDEVNDYSDPVRYGDVYLTDEFENHRKSNGSHSKKELSKKTKEFFNNVSVLNYVTIVDKNKPTNKTTVTERQIKNSSLCSDPKHEKHCFDRYSQSISAYKKNYHQSDMTQKKRICMDSHNSTDLHSSKLTNGSYEKQLKSYKITQTVNRL